MYKGNSRNFHGMILNIAGSDKSLEQLITKLEFISGAEILSRRNTEYGGILTIQAASFSAQRICEMARKFELSIAS